MFTTAPEITVDATVGQVIVASPAPTPTLSPAGPPIQPPYYPITSTPIPRPVYFFPPTDRSKQFMDKSLIVYGYGPINSEVNLKGFGISEKVTSDDTGLFIFGRVYSFTYFYPELCIQAVDDEKRVTQPTCIPSLPNNSIIPLEVGPILLSPTLSLSENKVQEGDNAWLIGKTTPNTQVNVFVSRTATQNVLSLVPEVNAYSLPIVDAKSDSEGKYEISLPTSNEADYKIFTSTKFNGDFSAKSNTLQFSVVSRFKTWLQRLIDFILANKILLLIVAEVLIFIILFIKALKRTTRRHRRHTEGDYLESIIKA